MKVIIQRDIPKVGKSGDIVTVADGYARNYLFPRAYAVAAKGGELKAHEARQALEKSRSAGKLSSAQGEGAKLDGKTLIMFAKVGTGTKLYGSITAQDIADMIVKETGVTVDKRRIGLPDPIKILGEYKVPVRLHSDISVEVHVNVTTEELLAKKKAVEEAAAVRAAAEAANTVETATVSVPVVVASATVTEDEYADAPDAESED